MDEKWTHEELIHYIQSALKFENCTAVSLDDECCPWLKRIGKRADVELSFGTFSSNVWDKVTNVRKRLVDERSIKIHRCCA